MPKLQTIINLILFLNPEFSQSRRREGKETELLFMAPSSDFSAVCLLLCVIHQAGVYTVQHAAGSVMSVYFNSAGRAGCRVGGWVGMWLSRLFGRSLGR